MIESANSYDKVSFNSKLHPGRHPNRLAVIGRFHGLSPVSVETARVLELGCSRGLALAAIATTAPKAQCIGIDLSQQQIEDGRKIISQLGIQNVELLCGDLSEAASRGTFDYVICHGVFSWVDSRTREQILDTIRAVLSPNGLGLISFNSLPGWGLRGGLRHFLKATDSPDETPESRIELARRRLGMIQGLLDYDRYYSLWVQQDLERLVREPDSYLFHEYLEPENTPFYLSEFVEQCSKHSLKFVSDSRFGHSLFGRLDRLEETAGLHAQLLEQGRVAAEEALDLIFNTSYREAIVCSDAARPFDSVDLSTCKHLLVASSLRPVAPATVMRAVESAEFSDYRGVTFAADDRVAKVALDKLSEVWPAPLYFDDLVAKVAESLSESAPEVGVSLEKLVGSLFSRELAELYAGPVVFASEVPSRPKVSALARLQLESGEIATNLKCETVGLGALESALARYMDGTRDRAQLLDGLMGEEVAQGRLAMTTDGQAVASKERQREALADILDDALSTIQKAALILR